MKVEIGRVKISKESSNLLGASKKLFKTICREKNVLKNKKLYESTFYIQETTKGSKKKVYGPYKGTCKMGSDDKKCIFNVVKLSSGKKIKKGGGGENNNNIHSNQESLLNMINQNDFNQNKLIEEINKCENVNIENSLGQTPLIIECRKKNSNKNIIIHLLLKGADVNKEWNRMVNINVSTLSEEFKIIKVTPLMLALDHFVVDEELINILLNYSADAGYTNSMGETPLIKYIQLCKDINKEIVEILLEKGAKSTINSVDYDGNTALYYAILKEEKSKDNNSVRGLVQLLLDNGAKKKYMYYNRKSKKNRVLELNLSESIKDLPKKRENSLFSKLLKKLRIRR